MTAPTIVASPLPRTFNVPAATHTVAAGPVDRAERPGNVALHDAERA